MLRRRYETVKAVEDLSFQIAEGERVGFLGPNGAGKTTTLKVLAGLLHPTSGDGARRRATCRTRAIRGFLQLITLVMGQKQQLLWDLPPSETYAMNRAIYDVPRAQAEETLTELVELLEIGDLISKPTRQLSLGERMKCELVAALLHRPRVLFLDEPTIGLDVSMQAKMRDFIRDYNERFGAAVLLTSHYMDDVVGALPARGRHRPRAPDLRRRPARAGAPRAPRQARHHPALEAGRRAPTWPAWARSSRRTRAQAVLSVPAAQASAVVRDALAALPIVDLTIEEPPLEEVMRELFRDRGREHGQSAAVRAARRRARDRRRLAGDRARPGRRLRPSCARAARSRPCCASASPRWSPTAPSSWSGS